MKVECLRERNRFGWAAYNSPYFEYLNWPERQLSAFQWILFLPELDCLLQLTQIHWDTHFHTPELGGQCSSTPTIVGKVLLSEKSTSVHYKFVVDIFLAKLAMQISTMQLGKNLAQAANIFSTKKQIQSIRHLPICTHMCGRENGKIKTSSTSRPHTSQICCYKLLNMLLPILSLLVPEFEFDIGLGGILFSVT